MVILGILGAAATLTIVAWSVLRYSLALHRIDLIRSEVSYYLPEDPDAR